MQDCYVRIGLVIFARDPLNKQNLKLVLDNSDSKLFFPVSYREKSCLHTAEELLYKYTALSTSDSYWINLSQSIIIDDEDGITVIYSIILPESVQLKCGQWYDIESLLRSELGDLSQRILQRLPEIINV